LNLQCDLNWLQLYAFSAPFFRLGSEAMKASNFSDAQKAFVLKQGGESGLGAEIFWKAGNSQGKLF
jgi:hypothetical protein